MIQPRFEPGWHDDPEGRGEFRYRSEDGWTPHIGVYEVVRGVAAWGPDPEGNGLRFWTGTAWTDRVIAPDGDPTVPDAKPPPFNAYPPPFDPNPEPPPDSRGTQSAGAEPSGEGTAELKSAGRARSFVKAHRMVAAGIGILLTAVLVLGAVLLFATTRESGSGDQGAGSGPTPTGTGGEVNLSEFCVEAVRPQLATESQLGTDAEWGSVTVKETGGDYRASGSVKWSPGGEQLTTQFICTVKLDSAGEPTLVDLELIDGD